MAKKFEYRIEKDAEKEMLESYDWYESQDPNIGLGESFLKSIFERIYKIIEKPESFSYDKYTARTKNPANSFILKIQIQTYVMKEFSSLSIKF
ncbi:MAG: hypothetical protein IPH52_10520 [Leptospiraceae bacterium]|nr:hypothetical protein [Leptospiraceae bacterium]